MRCKICKKLAAGYTLEIFQGVSKKNWYCLKCYETIGKYPHNIFIEDKVMAKDREKDNK